MSGGPKFGAWGVPGVEGGLHAVGHRPEGASLLLKQLLETPRAHPHAHHGVDHLRRRFPLDEPGRRSPRQTGLWRPLRGFAEDRASGCESWGRA
jgi:hypothetical protein